MIPLDPSWECKITVPPLILGCAGRLLDFSSICRIDLKSFNSPFKCMCFLYAKKHKKMNTSVKRVKKQQQNALDVPDADVLLRMRVGVGVSMISSYCCTCCTCNTFGGATFCCSLSFSGSWYTAGFKSLEDSIWLTFCKNERIKTGLYQCKTGFY